MGRKKNKEIKEETHGGCLPKLFLGFVILILIATVSPLARDDSNTIQTERTTAKSTATAKATTKPTATDKPTATPAVPGTYRPGIEGTNAYDVTVALKEVGLEHPKRENATSGYRWSTPIYEEGNVSYHLEVETDTKYRVTTMQVMMKGGNNNFVWWACACLFGENSQQVAWLKDNMWNSTTTTKTFADDIWTITPMDKGVQLTVQHVDAEAWYMSLI